MIVLTAVLIEHAAKFSVFTGQSSPQQGGSLCSSKRARRGMRRTSCRRPICTRVRLTGGSVSDPTTENKNRKGEKEGSSSRNSIATVIENNSNFMLFSNLARHHKLAPPAARM